MIESSPTSILVKTPVANAGGDSSPVAPSGAAAFAQVLRRAGSSISPHHTASNGLSQDNQDDEGAIAQRSESSKPGDADQQDMQPDEGTHRNNEANATHSPSRDSTDDKRHEPDGTDAGHSPEANEGSSNRRQTGEPDADNRTEGGASDNNNEKSNPGDDSHKEKAEGHSASENGSSRHAAAHADQAQKPDRTGERGADHRRSSTAPAKQAEADADTAATKHAEARTVAAARNARREQQGANTESAKNPDASDLKSRTGNRPQGDVARSNAGSATAWAGASARTFHRGDRSSKEHAQQEKSLDKAKARRASQSSRGRGADQAKASDYQFQNQLLQRLGHESNLAGRNAPMLQSGGRSQSGLALSTNGQAASGGAAGGGDAPSGFQVDGQQGGMNAARLARGLQNAVQQRGGAMTLRLTPPELGTVRIAMQISGSSVEAQFHTETSTARSMLHQQLGQLKGVLESQGLSVDRLGVQQMNASHGNSQPNAQSHTQQQGGQSPENNESPTDGRSRGFHQGRQQSQGDGERQQQDDPRQTRRTPRDFDEKLINDNA